MKHYEPPKKNLWTGRISNKWLYLYEKVHCTPLTEIPEAQKKSIALLGYACDAGVHRNQGRVGAVDGPDAIKSSFGKMPNHMSLVRFLQQYLCKKLKSQLFHLLIYSH